MFQKLLFSCYFTFTKRSVWFWVICTKLYHLGRSQTISRYARKKIVQQSSRSRLLQSKGKVVKQVQGKRKVPVFPCILLVLLQTGGCCNGFQPTPNDTGQWCPREYWNWDRKRPKMGMQMVRFGNGSMVWKSTLSKSSAFPGCPLQQPKG